jgi:rare lipoprotein A
MRCFLSGHGSAFFASRICSSGFRRVGLAMSSNSAGFRNVVRLAFVALIAVTLAACAQSSVTNKSELRATSRVAVQEDNRQTSVVTNRHLAGRTIKHSPFAPHRHAVKTQFAPSGLASFYSEGQQTANGEKFNPNDLTAAHPTLPFGTKVRVTNVATGRSVTVRINDRGPFVPGRVVDVSYSAAETLGITERGIAKVKLDVVR